MAPVDEHAQAMTIALDGGRSVSALLRMPPEPLACLILAHGAGAGMTHPFLDAVAAGLAVRRVATLRFQFPSMEQGSARPDRPAVAQGAVRAAVAAAAVHAPGLPLFAGGKSFGGRMTSGAQADAPLPGVRGLVFFGFPLHPPGRPGRGRAEHLQAVQLPMLFLQGTRDALADMVLMRAVVEALGASATLHVAEGADHSFHVLKRSGRTDAQALEAMLDAVAAWMTQVLA